MKASESESRAADQIEILKKEIDESETARFHFENQAGIAREELKDALHALKIAKSDAERHRQNSSEFEKSACCLRDTLNSMRSEREHLKYFALKYLSEPGDQL